MNSAAPFERREDAEALSTEQIESERSVDGVPSGMTAVYGRRPGSPSPWTAPAFDETFYMLNYLTHPEALRAALPYPLEPIPDAEPIATVALGHNRNMRMFDGKYSNYVEIGFFLPCQYTSNEGKTYRGATPIWFMMDTMNGDKTEGAEGSVVGFRETSGWMKHIGNVRLGGTGDQLHATCEVRGVRVVTMDMHTTESIEASDLPSPAATDYWLFVKEIPNCNFSGYDVRKVIGRAAGGFSNPDVVSNLKRGTGTVHLEYLETHPVARLECLEPRDAFQFTFGGTIDGSLGAYFEIDDLLK
ncbi:acetoacetate decarboxylase family protein [Frankia sp. Cpl3]|nr:acetoacetate decarboxylase family protein [Frankia sp. Cpl3]